MVTYFQVVQRFVFECTTAAIVKRGHECATGAAGSLNKLHEINVKLCFAQLQVKLAAKCSVDN